MVLGNMGGTLADDSHRLHWVRGGKKNWKKFFREMHKDPPNPSTAIWYAIGGVARDLRVYQVAEGNY